MLKEIRNNLRELGFNDKEIKIYIALTELGEAVASKIAKRSDLPRTTTIDILNKLKNDGYLTTHTYKNLTYYWIESPAVLSNILKNKVEIAENLNKLLANLYRSEHHFPFAQSHDTKSSIRKFITKTITNLKKGSVIWTIDAPEMENYAKIYSDTTEKNLFYQKRKSRIMTNTLIPFNSFKNIPEHRIKNQYIKIREMPEGINFKSSLWLIEDNLMHFSGKPPFLVVLQHEFIIFSVKSVFDFLWNISEPKN